MGIKNSQFMHLLLMMPINSFLIHLADVN